MSYPGQVLTFFVIPWGSRIWFSSPVFLLYRFSLRMFSCCYFILLCYRISSGFWSSVSSDDCQVNQLKQKLKLTLFASRASGISENYLAAFNRWEEFTKGVLGVPIFPVGPMDCAVYLQSRLQSSKSASAINCAFYAFK